MRQEPEETQTAPLVDSQLALVQQLKNLLARLRQLLYQAPDVEPFPLTVERQYLHLWLILNVLEDAVGLYEEVVDEAVPPSEQRTRPLPRVKLPQKGQ